MSLHKIEFPAADETDGEVIDPGTEGINGSINDKSKSKFVGSEESSGASSELIESDHEAIEVQSPVSKIKGNLNIQSSCMSSCSVKINQV